MQAIKFHTKNLTLGLPIKSICKCWTCWSQGPLTPGLWEEGRLMELVLDSSGSYQPSKFFLSKLAYLLLKTLVICYRKQVT